MSGISTSFLVYLFLHFCLKSLPLRAFGVTTQS
jgi:hypothetical protein